MFESTRTPNNASHSVNAIMDLFFAQHGAVVKPPATYARDVIIDHAKAQWKVQLDPDAIVIATLAYSAPPSEAPYPATLMHALSLTQAMLNNWQQNGDGSLLGLSRLDPYRKGGIDFRIVDKLNVFYTTHVYEGLYRKHEPQTYDALTHVDVAAADFKKFIWDQNLRTKYQAYLQNFWIQHARFYPVLGRASFIKSAFTQVAENSLQEQDKYLAMKAAGLSPSQAWEDLTPAQLSAPAVIPKGVEVSMLMIYRYTSSDILMIKDTQTGRILLYIPGNSSPIHSFGNEDSLKDWIGEQCRDLRKRRALEGHFKEVDDSDGLLLSGLHTALDGLAAYPRILNGATGTWPPRHIVRAGPRIVGDPFVFLYNSLRERLDSDAISMFSTQGDYRKETFAKGVSNSLLLVGFVAMVAPEAIPVLVALSTALIGLGADQLIKAKTLKEREIALGRIEFGVLNALPFVIEKVAAGVAALGNIGKDAESAGLVGTDAPMAPSVEHTPVVMPPPFVSASGHYYEPPNLRSLQPPFRRALRAFEAPPEAWQGLPNVRDADGNLDLNLYGHGDSYFLKLFDKGYRIRRSKSGRSWRVITEDGKPGPYVKPGADGHWDIDLHGLKGGGTRKAPTSISLGVEREAALSAQVKTLYPNLSREEIIGVINELKATGTSIEIQLARLATEYDALSRTLGIWVAAPPELVQVSAQRSIMVSRVAKRQVADIIKRCWRRETPVTDQAAAGYFGGYELDFSAIKISRLPQLPGDFSHVTLINLERTSITERSASALIRKCSNARWVKLEGNFLRSVPEGVSDLPRLTRLMLADNQIVLSPNSVRTLTAIQTLRMLNLNGNPIGPLLDVTPMRRLINLLLRNTGIDAVPEGACTLEGLNCLDLRSNQITSLPEAYYQIPLNVRRGLLDGNPLSLPTLRRLLRNVMTPAPTSGMQVWLQQATSDAVNAARRSAWSIFEQEPQSAEFFDVINRLRQSEDFAFTPESVAHRVWQVLEAGAEDQALRLRLIGMASRPETCVDGVTMIFGNMELEVLLNKAKSLAVDGDESHQLLKLVRGLSRLEHVDNIARLDASARPAGSLSFEEDIEVVLAYRIGLAESLELPINVKRMKFPQIAGVSNELIEAARLEVLAAETDAALIEYAIFREFWVDYLKKTYEDEFAATNKPFHEEMDHLYDQKPFMRDGTYMVDVEWVKQQQIQSEATLMRQLTQAELANGPRANSVS